MCLLFKPCFFVVKSNRSFVSTLQPSVTKKKPKSGKRKGSSKGSKGSKGKKKKGGSKSRIASTTTTIQTRDVDMLDPPAMYNLYYIAHGPVEALELRGFGWAAAPKKKGKKGKKKGKK